MGDTMRGLGAGVWRACGVIAVATTVALAVLMGAAPTALAAEAGTGGEATASGSSAAKEAAGPTADTTPVATAETDGTATDSPRVGTANQGIYAVFYKNSDGQSYTLVIQSGNALDPAYPKPADDLVVLVCDKGSNVGGTCGCSDRLGTKVGEGVRHFVTRAVVREGVAPHSLDGWFAGYENLESVDLSHLDTTETMSMQNVFRECVSLESIDFPTLGTSKVEDMGGLFSGCSSLAALDLSKLDTTSVTNMESMFSGCQSLKSLDLSQIDTLKVVNMREMFAYCTSLERLDLSQLDTPKVTNMSGMFVGCSSLKALVLLGRFDTSQVQDMGHMFSGCSSLKALDLSRFSTSNVTDMGGMFVNCSSLGSLSFPSGFKTSWVTDMSSMFDGCRSLELLDLSSFDVSRVKSMGRMLSFVMRGYAMPPFPLVETKVILPAGGDFSKAGLTSDFTLSYDGQTVVAFKVKWRNEKGEVFAADAIPARTAGAYTAVFEKLAGDSNGGGSGDGSNNGSGNGSGSGSNNSGDGNGPGSNSNNPSPKRTVAFTEAVALPLDATGVAMGKDDVVRDLAKRFGSREGFPADADSVVVTIMRGGEEVETIDPRRAGTYEVTAVYAMPDGAERVIEATYTVADPAAKAPVKATVKPTTRLAQTGDEVSATAPLATAALAACALAAAIAVRRRIRG